MPYEQAGVVPHVGDIIEVADCKGTWALNNVTLTTSSSTIKFLNQFMFLKDLRMVFVD